MFEMLDHNGACHFGSSFALGSLNPICVKKIEFEHPRTNPDQAMASSATSATSFELIEDQTLTAEEVEMASQEAQEIRTREAAVAAGLVLDEPEAPPSASATDVMKDLSSALERLRVAFATPTSGLGAPTPLGHISHGSEKVAAADSWFPEVLLGLPPSVFLGISGVDFWSCWGRVWPACSICTRHPARLEHACSMPRLGPGRSIGGSNPPFHHG